MAGRYCFGEALRYVIRWLGLAGLFLLARLGDGVCLVSEDIFAAASFLIDGNEVGDDHARREGF